MVEPKKSYYAIIPANVRYDEKLTPNAKLLYGELTALSNEKGYCWAGDRYFANLYSVSKRTIQNWFKSLEDQGYIYREVKRKEGSEEIDHRYCKILPYPSENNFTTPTEKNFRDNTTSINNTFNNTKNSKPLSGKPDSIPYSQVIDYLNDKAGKNFKNVESNRKLIRARFHDGFTLDDFKKVIDTKVADWLHDDKMSSYLRPATLFGNKFDQYRNQQPKGVKENQPREYKDLGF